jgi:hypothetical protein
VHLFRGVFFGIPDVSGADQEPGATSGINGHCNDAVAHIIVDGGGSVIGRLKTERVTVFEHK